MLFTDVSSKRAVSAFEKVNFWISREGKHIGMTKVREELLSLVIAD